MAPTKFTYGLGQYFDSATYSDFTVRFSGKEVEAHKLVLASESDFFRRAFEGGFKEANVLSIELHDDDPDAVMTMLAYCYGKQKYGFHTKPGDEFDLTSLGHDQRKLKENIAFALKLYVVGGKYIMPGLQTSAADIFRLHVQNLSTKWDEGQCDSATIVREVYAMTSRNDFALHSLVIGFLRRHIEKFQRQDKFEELLRDVPDIAVALVKSFALYAGVPAGYRRPVVAPALNHDRH